MGREHKYAMTRCGKERVRHYLLHYHLEENQSGIHSNAGLDKLGKPLLVKEKHGWNGKEDSYRPSPHAVEVLHVKYSLELSKGDIRVDTVRRQNNSLRQVFQRK